MAAALIGERYWFVLLVVGLVFGAYLVWFDQPGSGSDDAGATAPALFADFGGQINAVVVHLGEERIRVVRENGAWRYVSIGGVQDNRPATAEFIAARVAMLMVARVERRFPAAGRSLETFGISPAGMRLAVFIEGRQSPLASFQAGARTPDGFGQYFRDESSGEIIVLPAYQLGNLRRLASGARTQDR